MGGRLLSMALRSAVACVLVFGLLAEATAQVRVRGYTRKDGTYVAPHYRSSPNRSRSDNYSTRGNYNPYTGAKGTVNPYPTTSYSTSIAPTVTFQPSPVYQAPESMTPTHSSWRQYRGASAAPAAAPADYAAPPTQATTTGVYLCEDAAGNRHYLAYPRAGCTEIQATYRPQAVAAQTVGLQRVTSYGGGGCTYDCSGHDAGYGWAEEHGIDDPDDCGGNSQSFIEGCQAYAEEQQEEESEAEW